MDKQTLKILGGMSAAGLILAGSLPLMAKTGVGQTTTCLIGGGGTRAKSAKARDKNAAAKKKTADNAKKAPPTAKPKNQRARTTR